MAIVPIIIPPKEKPASDPSCLLQYESSYWWECLRTKSEVDAYKSRIDAERNEMRETEKWLLPIIIWVMIFILFITYIKARFEE